MHRHCGHLHHSGLFKLVSLGIIGGASFSKLPPMFFCPDFATAKFTVADISRRSTRYRDPPHPFHTLAHDIQDPTSPPYIFGNRCALGADCYSIASVVVVLLHRKSHAPSVLTDIFATISSYGYKSSRIRIDNYPVIVNLEKTIVMKITTSTRNEIAA